MKIPTHSLANETAVDEEVSFVGFSNEATFDDAGWITVPYGSWPHADGLQQFGRSEAEAITKNFKSIWNSMKRAVLGAPVFKGHPDLVDSLQIALTSETDPAKRKQLQLSIRELANQYPDRTEYGQISDMEVRDNGLAIRPVLGAAGMQLVKRGLKYISPHWTAKPVGTLANGAPIWAPDRMLSIGLTDRPNIPGKSLLNSASAGSHNDKSKTENITMPDWLKKLLGLANEATEADATAAIAALKNRPEQTALANEQSARTAAEGRITALSNETTKLSSDLKGAQTALANERKARIDDMIATAIRGGKITEADKAVWSSRLLANFEDESKALANAKQAVKTAATATRTGADDGDADDSGPKIKNLVNAEMAKLTHLPMANRYNTAFANVKKSNPDLFKVVEPC